MAYQQKGTLDRSLTDKEEADFREYAQKNDPPDIKKWNTYHPVCREEWLKRGINPLKGSVLSQDWSDDYEECETKNWIEINLPYGSVFDSDFVEKDSLSNRELNKPGTLIETEEGIFLIGHINEMRGVCDDCTEFRCETIVLRYKVIWDVDKEIDSLTGKETKRKKTENPFRPI